MVKWLRIIFLLIAWLFPVAILVQVLFVGLSLFTGQSYWDSHIGFGHTIGILPILLVILGYLGRLPRRTIILSWLALGTYLVQAEVFAARIRHRLCAICHPSPVPMSDPAENASRAVCGCNPAARRRIALFCPAP